MYELATRRNLDWGATANDPQAVVARYGSRQLLPLQRDYVHFRAHVQNGLCTLDRYLGQHVVPLAEEVPEIYARLRSMDDALRSMDNVQRDMHLRLLTLESRMRVRSPAPLSVASNCSNRSVAESIRSAQQEAYLRRGAAEEPSVVNSTQ